MYSTSFFSQIFSEFKSSIHLALPLVASNLIVGLNGFIATIMISHLGKEQLAANALVWSIYIVVILFFIGVISAVSIMIAQSFGAKDNKAIGICFNQGLIMATIFAVPMMLIMWASPIILVWTDQDPNVINAAKPFFHALIWSMLPLNLIVVIEQFLFGTTKARLVMIMSAIQLPVEVGFYYAFLFGKFGFPKLGLAGIGYGLTASCLLISFAFGCYLYFTKQFKIYNLFHQWWRINRKFLRELFRIGVPLGFIYCVEVALFAAVAIMMGTLGTTVLAAHQIAYQYLMLALFIIFALSQTATIRIGNEVGRNNRAALKITAIVNMLVSFGCMLIFSIFYCSFPLLAISLDIDPHSTQLAGVVNEATKFLAIVAVMVLVECLRLVSLGSLRGLKDTKFPVLVSVIGFWCVAFPCAYLFAFKFKFGGVGIWWGMTLGLFVAGVILFIRFSRQVKTIDLEALITKA